MLPDDLYPRDVNERGQVLTGTADGRPVLYDWRRGTRQALAPLVPGARAIGYDLDDAGSVVGLSDTAPAAECADLPERCGVVAIPHQVFYDRLEAGRPYVRWAFCKADEVLDEAIARLTRLTEARSLAFADARGTNPLAEMSSPSGREG